MATPHEKKREVCVLGKNMPNEISGPNRGKTEI